MHGGIYIMVLQVHANPCDSPPNICIASSSLVCMNWKVGGTRWRRTQKWTALKDARLVRVKEFDQWYSLDAKHTPPSNNRTGINKFKMPYNGVVAMAVMYLLLYRNLALISKTH